MSRESHTILCLLKGRKSQSVQRAITRKQKTGYEKRSEKAREKKRVLELRFTSGCGNWGECKVFVWAKGKRTDGQVLAGR